MPKPNKRSLTQATVSGVSWNFAGRMCERFGQLITAIILARLLDPEVFGLVAMVLVILTFGTIIAEGGFGQSLIQKKKATPNDEVTAFVYNLATSLVLWVVAYLAAPQIAVWLGYIQLAELIPVLAISLPLGALANVPLRLLARRMEFRKTVLISLWRATAFGA
jgi:O-antigen/teichoic acid export membrane protein